MNLPADTREAVVWFPVPATREAGNSVQDTKKPRRQSSGSFTPAPVMFLAMSGGDLFIRGDGASCLYVRKQPDDPTAVH